MAKTAAENKITLSQKGCIIIQAVSGGFHQIQVVIEMISKT
jgi:hypothetical protein